MDNVSQNIVVARDELQLELETCLFPPFWSIILKIWDTIPKPDDFDTNIDSQVECLRLFQEKLQDIPTWNKMIVENMVQEIKEKECPYLEELIAGLFVSNVRILTFVRVDGRTKSIQVSLPQKDVFVHKALVKVAKEFYNDPWVMITDNHQSKLNAALVKVQIGLKDAVRHFIPRDQILKTYLVDVLETDQDGQRSETTNRVLETNADPTTYTETKVDADEAELKEDVEEEEEDFDVDMDEEDNSSSSSSSDDEDVVRQVSNEHSIPVVTMPTFDNFKHQNPNSNIVGIDNDPPAQNMQEHENYLQSVTNNTVLQRESMPMYPQQTHTQYQQMPQQTQQPQQQRQQFFDDAEDDEF